MSFDLCWVNVLIHTLCFFDNVLKKVTFTARLTANLIHLDQSASGYQASTAVFALSTLLSSVQCFNVIEAFSEDVLMPLKFFTDYGRIAATEAPDLGTPFQVCRL